MFLNRFSIIRVSALHGLICAVLLCTATAQARSGPAAGKKADKVEGLDAASVRSFIQRNLMMIAKRDERIFSVVTDGEKILSHAFVLKVLGYRPKTDQRNARAWRRIFPGYSRIPKRHIKYIKLTSLIGPLRADVKVEAGGTEKKLRWKIVPSRFVLVKVKLPRRSRQLNCKVYKVDGRLYWEPFGW